MKNFIFSHKVVIIAAILAFIFVFFFVPFIITPSLLGTDTVNPCPYPSHPSLCSLVAPQTLFEVMKDKETIESFSWYILIVYLIVFAIVFGELKLLVYGIQFQKKTKNRVVLVKKTLALAAFIVISIILVIIGNLILSFFGLSLTL